MKSALRICLLPCFILIFLLFSCTQSQSQSTKEIADYCKGIALTTESNPRRIPLELIQLPSGFTIQVYASYVEGARSMTLSENGILFVGTRLTGNVYALLDCNQDHKVDKVFTLARNLNMPNGVAFQDGNLYVAEVHRVLRYDNIEAHLDNPLPPVVVNDQFPSDRHHGWKFIRLGPDGKLYIPVGGPCNVCIRSNPLYASIHRMNLDGSGLEVFAKGVRNSVGFDWHPETQELWFTDNGRDYLGDNLPPDELNHAPRQGMNFGFPHCHGKGIADPQFGTGHRCSEFTPAAVELGPHVASLGLRFYTGNRFPSEYHNQIFIAEHGSWNRSSPIGYRVTLVRLANNKPTSYEIFAQGWLNNGRAWGRPVDLEIMPNGDLLVSDDAVGAIYRISYSN